MIAVETFAKVRAALLNPNARDTELSMLFERFGESVKPLAEVYSLFDGEAMWGALLPGYRLFPIRESMELADATQDAWEWIEEERGDLAPASRTPG